MPTRYQDSCRWLITNQAMTTQELADVARGDLRELIAKRDGKPVQVTWNRAGHYLQATFIYEKEK